MRRGLDDLVQKLHATDLEVARHRRILRQRGTADVSQDDEFAFRPIHHVRLAIPRGGEDTCRAFWGGVLGMRELEKPTVLAARGGCWCRGGALARRLEEAGHPVTWDDDFPGHNRFYAVDPFGNRLEFLQPHAS